MNWWCHGEPTTAYAYRTALCKERDKTATEWRRTYSCWTTSDSLVCRADTCAVTLDTTTSLLFWKHARTQTCPFSTVCLYSVTELRYVLRDLYSRTRLRSWLPVWRPINRKCRGRVHQTHALPELRKTSCVLLRIQCKVVQVQQWYSYCLSSVTFHYDVLTVRRMRPVHFWK